MVACWCCKHLNFTFQASGYTCKCLSGYGGEFCERELNSCDSNPCMNTAQCVDQGSGYRSVHYKTLIEIATSAPIRSNIRTMNYDFTNPIKFKINSASLG